MTITPKLKSEEGVSVETLELGDVFLLRGDLHILTDIDPTAVSLTTGNVQNFEGWEIVQKVDCTIKWELSKKKKSTTKKK